ncbi:ATP-dependent Clp protease adaptor ClpS [Bacteroidota bacterium]
MDNKEILKEKNIVNEDIKSGNDKFLILHNDEINTFDFVIETLVDVCKHDSTQAEQCAWITHYQGKCDIKKGQLSTLKPLKDEIIDRGLSVTID